MLGLKRHKSTGLIQLTILIGKAGLGNNRVTKEALDYIKPFCLSHQASSPSTAIGRSTTPSGLRVASSTTPSCRSSKTSRTTRSTTAFASASRSSTPTTRPKTFSSKRSWSTANAPPTCASRRRVGELSFAEKSPLPLVPEI